jgi:hypothetical protein
MHTTMWNTIVLSQRMLQPFELEVSSIHMQHDGDMPCLMNNHTSSSPILAKMISYSFRLSACFHRRPRRFTANIIPPTHFSLE